MPYPNEHAVRLKSPGKYKRFRRENDKFGKGIDAIWGITKDGKAELQAVRFDKKLHSAADAKAWATKHGHKPISVHPAKDHDEGAPVGVANATVPVALRDVSIQYKPRSFSEPGQSWKTKIGETSEGWQIFKVSGQYVRNTYDTDYTEGGHWLVYPEYVPPYEIWIEGEQSKEDIEMATIHEIIEAKIMETEGLDYDQAHDKTIMLENLIRQVGKVAEVKERNG